MALTRRELLGGMATSAIAISMSEKADAWKRGGNNVGNNSRVTINAPPGYLNIAKGFAFIADPANQDSNGYPVTTPSVAQTANVNLPSNYWGEFVWKWSGTGSMDINGGPPTIVSQSTQVSGNFQVGDSSGGNQVLVGVTAPRIQFKFGVNIQGLSDSGVSNGAGGTMIRVATKTGFSANISAGAPVNVAGILTQTNANGTWTVATANANAFDLVGSTWNAGQGTSGVVGVATIQYINTSIRISATGAFSGFTNLIWCKAADEAAVAGGQITDTVLLNQLKTLMNPNNVASPNVWLRFMDFSGAQQNWEADYSQRVLASQICYNAQYFRNSYWIGAVARTSDAYTCSDPSISVWNGSSYIDNAIVQGHVSVANTGGVPTLAVGGHPAKPIFDFINNTAAILFSTALPATSAGISLQFTFSASWINSGTPVVVTYVTTTTGPNGDDTASAIVFALNIASAFQANAALIAAGLVYGNPFISIYVRTAQAGRMTLTQTSGPAVVTIGTVAPGAVAVGDCSFMYNYLLDGWVYRSGGIVLAGPLEMAAEMCNAIGAHCWWNWSTNKGGLITAVTNFFATNLNAGLKFGTEPANELWNSSALPNSFWTTLGVCLGFPLSGNASVFSYGALRAVQFYALSSAAWSSAGRAASQHYVIQPSQTFDVTANGNFDTAQMKGAYLNRSGGTVNGIPTNAIYGTFGALGGGVVSVNYNISPNRPVDITGATGCAPYWSSHWLGNGGSITANGSGDITGTVLQNAPWLQAALDFANGNTAAAFTSMSNQFLGLTAGGTVAGYNFADMQGTFTTEEALCAQYDASRPSGMSPLIILDYEAGPSWAEGANGINGINSTGLSDIAAGDITSLANRITALGWNVSAFTQSATNSASEMATMAMKLFQGWKYDITRTGTAANTGSYKNMIKTGYYAARKNTNLAREAHGAQFGYASNSQWSLMFPDYNTLAKYTNYTAISEWNA